MENQGMKLDIYFYNCLIAQKSDNIILYTG